MKIFSNLATSVDGKIATGKAGDFLLGSKHDWRAVLKLREKADAVVIGASTLRSPKGAALVTESKKHLIHAVVSSNLTGISPDWHYFRDPKLERILFVTSKISPSKRKAFERSSEIVSISEKNIAEQIIGELKKRGARNLLVEGGGTLMWEFARHNLIDFYHVTVTPRILGGKNAPTLVDGEGFAPSQTLKLKLVNAERIGNEFFLTYKKTAKRGR